ncbi:MAG TPA: hypothetical protein PKO23_20080, partial [Candidatus Hydrogenedentes bacterium]|nr:hypothetical protein [Candidatus Hydrogenedentota bacterium]
NPVGILNTYVGISIPHPERKDVGNDKSCTWERGLLDSYDLTSLSLIRQSRNQAPNVFPQVGRMPKNKYAPQ